MNINSATAHSLGDKIATLELTTEESALLATILADDEEVAGFKASPKIAEVRSSLLPSLRDQLPLGYTEVEWTYAKSDNGWIIIQS